MANQPILKGRTNRGNISAAVFRNVRTNAQTGEKFVADSLSIQTGYKDQQGNWVNPSISVDARLIPNLILMLTHLDSQLSAIPTPVQGQPQTQAPQQPAVAPQVQVDDIPF
jgi:hypothetical protein